MYQLNMTDIKMAMKRIKTELVKLEKNKSDQYSYNLCKTSDGQLDMFNWEVSIVGPPDTPYAGRDYHFKITFGNEYPLKPPVVKFIKTSDGTQMSHRNISTSTVCVDILQNKWSPAMTVDALLVALRSLIAKGD